MTPNLLVSPLYNLAMEQRTQPHQLVNYFSLLTSGSRSQLASRIHVSVFQSRVPTSERAGRILGRRSHCAPRVLYQLHIKHVGCSYNWQRRPALSVRTRLCLPAPAASASHGLRLAECGAREA